MPSRSEIQSFLINHGLEAAASDQSSLCLIEKLIEILGEPDMPAIEAGKRQAVILLTRDGGYRMEDVWEAMWAARFRGE